MEQKQRENEEYLEKKEAEITELEKEHEELQLKTEEKKAQDLESEIADTKKMILSDQKSAEERIAALEEQMLSIVVKVNSLQTTVEGILQSQTAMDQTALLTTVDVIDRISNVRDNFDTNLINISTKLETLERTLTNKFEWKEDRKPTILVLGGEGSNKLHLLNRDRTRWSTLSLNLPMSLYCGGAVYLDGEIYIFDGRNWGKKTYKLNREMKWIQLADMNQERWDISNSSVVFDGCVCVFGGWNDSEVLNSVEKYKPEENKWIEMPSMTEKRRYAAAAACNGKLFVSGGYGDSFLRSMECFDPAIQKWTMFLDLPSPTWWHAMISDGICLTVLGGRGERGEEKSVWKINPNEENATWKNRPQMRESRYFFTANLLGDNIFAIGGEGSRKKVEFFNGETWEDGPELPKGIYGTCSIVIPADLAAALSSHQ